MSSSTTASWQTPEPAVMTPVYEHCTAKGPQGGAGPEAARRVLKALDPHVNKGQIFTGLPVKFSLFTQFLK